MHPRASSLIATLNLAPHPEGGFFREIFRSSAIVTPSPTGSQRRAITSIYYLLSDGQVSKFHRVGSDEVWHFLEGDSLELHRIDPSLVTLQTHLLGPASDKAQPVHVVPANFWQAAVPTGAFTLVGCTAGPGFEYEDFTLLAENANMVQTVGRRFPRMATLL